MAFEVSRNSTVLLCLPQLWDGKRDWWCMWKDSEHERFSCLMWGSVPCVYTVLVMLSLLCSFNLKFICKEIEFLIHLRWLSKIGLCVQGKVIYSVRTNSAPSCSELPNSWNKGEPKDLKAGGFVTITESWLCLPRLGPWDLSTQVVKQQQELCWLSAEETLHVGCCCFFT